MSRLAKRVLTGASLAVATALLLFADDRAGPRPSLLFHLEKDDERVRVMAYGGQISLPVHAAESLEFALTTDEYRIGDIPGDLDDPGKLVLIKKLVREGLVEVL